MVCCAELDADDVAKARSPAAVCDVSDGAVGSDVATPSPSAPSPAAVADSEPQHLQDEPTIDADTLTAMQWASKLTSLSCVRELISSLPAAIVNEQVAMYHAHMCKPAVAELDAKLIVSGPVRSAVRRNVSMALYRFCINQGVDPHRRLPRNAVPTFMRSCLDVTLTT